MKNAEKYVSEPILSSCLVMPKSAAKGILAGAVAQSAGAAIKAAGDIVAARQGVDKAPLETGTASLGLLGLTADEIVLVNGRRGMLKPVANGLAGRAPRRGVRAELGDGELVAGLRLSWADGSSWELDVPRAEAKRARRLIEQLGDA